VPPGWLVALVQVVIGAVAGARFAGINFRELRRIVVLAILWAAVLLMASCGAALLGTHLFGRSFVTLVLALAPGGIAEMTMISYALAIETAFIITCQVVRNFSVQAFAPLVYQLVGKPSSAPPPT
jgi:membrane AbrB-like protein